MSRGHWRSHIANLVLGTLLAVVVGLATGYLREVLLAAAAGYLAWHVWHSGRLYRWLLEKGRELPTSKGIWGDIFREIDTLQRRNREQEDRFRGIIRDFRDVTDAVPDALIAIDPEDQITWFNRPAGALLGLREASDLGQAVTNLIRDPDFANWLSVREEVETPMDLAAPGDEGRRLQASAIDYQDGQRLLVLRDVTDIRQLEQVRRDFVANVSHELRTPLTVLLGYLEMLVGNVDEENEPVVERMQTQAKLMQALLNDLLELSRLQGGATARGNEEVDVPAVLMQLKEQAEELSQGRHALAFELDYDLGLSGSAADLESAFRNLIVNAIRYTPGEGRVTVRWQRRDDGAVLEVEDDGIGIPKRDLPRITERFYRVGSDRARQTGGTGLGLSIVKHVLNAHEARLEIESELGEGSTFRCVFPTDRVVERLESETDDAA